MIPWITAFSKPKLTPMVVSLSAFDLFALYAIIARSELVMLRTLCLLLIFLTSVYILLLYGIPSFTPLF
jgi:hypothetical protein